MINTKANPQQPKRLANYVIETLLYYDVFNYPLKASEVFQFLGTNHLTVADVTDELMSLKQQGQIFQFGEFYSLKKNDAPVTRRVAGNEAALKAMKIAFKKSRLIASFPFVRAVMASGSLSKGYMDEQSDLDFFIVTEPGRLWISRILLVVYKRIFLFNSHKHFCVNYFIDSAHLEIEEKNLFTATELATVVPLYGAQYYDQLQKANPWLLEFFPNFMPRSVDAVPIGKQNFFKRLMEGTINLLFAEKLNQFFMQITLKRWKKIYQRDYPNADFQVAFKSKDYASKSHPKHYQKKVMELYQEKLASFTFNRS